MAWASNEVLTVLTFLLPGFIAAWVFYGLTPAPKPGHFESIVQALILTMFVQALLVGVQFLLTTSAAVKPVGVWDEQAALVWSVVLALALGLFAARVMNSDKLHAALRWAGITAQTSYPSEWFAEFKKNQTYVVLHLTGERRVYGWPEQWPTSRTVGEFSIAEAEWLDGDQRIPAKGVKNIVIPATVVEMVEFMHLGTETEATPSDDQEADTAAP